jgi:small subunit ribosomal protein S8
MVTDQIADLLTRIRNAHSAEHPSLTVPASTVKENILSLLCDEGYLDSFERIEDAEGKPAIKVKLRYTEKGAPAIKEIKRLSTPGRRVYVPSKDIPTLRGGLGLVVVSTSQGVLSNKEARKRGIGGELICSVF